MELKNNKGITMIDIVIGLGIFTIFMSLLAVILTDINSTNLDVSMQSEAIIYAINEVEAVKTKGIEYYIGETNTDFENLVACEEGYIDDTSYYKEVFIIDYSDINADEEIESDIVKKAIVDISYKIDDEIKTITLMTILN